MACAQWRSLYLVWMATLSLAVFSAAVNACNIASGDFDCDAAVVANQLSQDKSSTNATFRDATISTTSFVRVWIPAADFTAADLTSVIFNGPGSLQGASFLQALAYEYSWTHMNCDNINMQGASFDYGTVSNTSLRNANWTGFQNNGPSEFTNCDLKGGDFRTARIQEHAFVNISMDNIQSIDALWAQCSFSSLTMRDAVWDGSRLRDCLFENASIVNMSAQGTTFHPTSLRNVVVENAAMNGAQLLQIVGTDVEFLDSKFTATMISGFNISKGRFSSCTFDHADTFRFRLTESSTSLVSFRFASFLYAVFDYHITVNDTFDLASFTGSRFYRSELRSTSFKSINATQLRFTESLFDNVSFEDAYIGESSFADSRDLQDTGSISFKSANVSQTNFQNASFPFIDFEGATMMGAQLRGISMPNGNFQNVDGRQANFEALPIGLVSSQGSNLENSVFDNADLRSSLFTQAHLSSASFKGADLRGASFRFANLSGVSFDGSDLKGADMSEAKGLPSSCENFCASRGCLCNAIPTCPNGQRPAADVDCTDAVLSNYLYAGMDLSNIVLNGAELNRIGFESVSLQRADIAESRIFNLSFFDGVNAMNASFINSRIENVDIVGTVLENTNWDGAEFRGTNLISGADLSNTAFTNVDVYDQFEIMNTPLRDTALHRLTRMGLASITFRNMNGVRVTGDEMLVMESQWMGGSFNLSTFRSSDFSRASFSDISFSACDFANAHFAEVAIMDAKFEMSAMNRIDFSDSRITDTSFQGTNLEGARFNGANLTNVHFDLANLADAEFLGAFISDDSLFVGANCTGIQLDGGETCEEFCASRSCICASGPVPSLSPSPTPSIMEVSLSPSRTPTRTPAGTPTESVVFPSPFRTPSPSAFSPSQSALPSPSRSASVSPTPKTSLSSSPSLVATLSKSPSPAIALSKSPSPTVTLSGSPSASPLLLSPTPSASPLPTSLPGSPSQSPEGPSKSPSHSPPVPSALVSSSLAPTLTTASVSPAFQTPTLAFSETPSLWPSATPTGSLSSEPEVSSEYPSPTFEETGTPLASESASQTSSPISTISTSPTVSATQAPGDNPCFPAYTKVRLESGIEARMDELAIGTRIQVPTNVAGLSEYSEIYLFGHRLPDEYAEYVIISLANEKGLAVSPNHYVYVNSDKELKLAGAVEIGDLMVLDTGLVVPVLGIERRIEKGVFNPHTLQGDLFVDGVKVSSYTSIVPPMMGHILLAPMRVVYRLWNWNMIGNRLESHLSSWKYRVVAKFVEFVFPNLRQ